MLRGSDPKEPKQSSDARLTEAGVSGGSSGKPRDGESTRRSVPVTRETGMEFPPLPIPVPTVVAEIAASLIAPPDPVTPTAAELARVAGYEILSILGRGGMGVVYRARDVKLDRIVALKMIQGGT